MKMQVVWGFLFLAACAHDPTTFEAKVISMTESRPPPCTDVGDSVREEWCEGDQIRASMDGSYGFYDEVVFKAQKKHRASHLINVKISTTEINGKTCAILAGNLLKTCGK